jgi:flagellin-like hook-associated protein FlgL
MDKFTLNSQQLKLQSFITLLPNFREALSQASKIYERMSTLAQMASGPFLTETEYGASSVNVLLNIEFKPLSGRISSLIDMEMNGRMLFGGVKADFTQGLQNGDDFIPTNLPQITSNYVKATSGVITLDLCSGVAENQIWISPWGLPYALNSFLQPYAGHGLPDASALTVNLYEYVEGILTTVRGQASGAPNDGDCDTFTTNFNSCDANLGANFLNNNVTSLGILPEFTTDTEILVRSCNKLLGVILKGRLEFEGELSLSTPSDNSTQITIIDVNTGNTYNYEISLSYEPNPPYNDIDIPGSDNIFPAISFGELECSSISSTDNALTVLSEIDAPFENLLNSRTSIAASQRSYHHELNKINLNEISIEVAHSKVLGADFAEEPTNSTDQMLNAQMASSSAQETIKFADFLISLTTKHH